MNERTIIGAKMSKSNRGYELLGRNEPSESEGSKKGRKFGWLFLVGVIGTILLVMGILGTISLGILEETLTSVRVKTYCLNMQGDKLHEPGAGDPNGFGYGSLTIDINQGVISYLIYIYLTPGSTPSSMYIQGPVTSSNPLYGPIFLPTGGSSMNVATVNGGQISGSFHVTRTQAQQIIDNPTFFYLSLRSTSYPAGAIGDRFGEICQINT